MKTSESLCCILGKNDIVFCAFVHLIVFGKINNGEFVENQFFKFSLNKICQLFCAFFKLIKSFSKKDFTASGFLCDRSETMYKWKLQNNSDAQIVLSIEINDTSIFELHLSICDFNDIILLASHMILPCLNLKTKEFSVLQLLITADLDQILKLKSEKAVKTFLESHQNNFALSNIEYYNISLIISYHLDIIVAINTMKSLYNQSLNITHQNIDMMLSCH